MWNNNFNQYPRMPFNSQTGNYNTYNSNSPYQTMQSSGANFLPYQQSQSAQPQNNLIWVRGKENARSMQLQPNSTVVMLDNQANKFYIKTTDDIGLGRLRVFNYSEEEDIDSPTVVTQAQQPLDLSNYVTKQELEKIITTLKGEVKHEQSVSTTKQQPVKKQQQF